MAYEIKTIFTASYNQLKNTLNAVKGQFKTIEIQTSNLKNQINGNLGNIGNVKSNSKIQSLNEQLEKAQNSFNKAEQQAKELDNVLSKIRSNIAEKTGLNLEYQTSQKTQNPMSKKEYTSRLDKLVQEDSEYNKILNKQIKLTEKTEEQAMKIESIKNKLANVNEELNKADTTKFFQNMTKISAIGVASISVPLTMAGYKALQTAGQFEAATQTLEYTLGDAKKAVDDFVENNANKLGIAQQDAYQFANIYSNLLTSMTNDQKTNANMTNKLLQASAVIMSKTGKTFTDVADRIRSGLLGNIEAIEDLGINVNVALLETTDAFKKISNGRSWDQLSFQEQQQIRLLGILEQTSKKYGETVADNLSLKLAQTTAVFKDAKTSASQFLAVGLEPMLNVIKNIGNGLNIFLQYLNSLDDGTKKMVATFLTVIAVIPPIVLVFAMLMKAINSFNTMMAKSTILQKIFGKGLIRSILGSSLLVIAGIMLLSSAFGGLGNVVKNIGAVMQVAFLTAGSIIIKCIAGIINVISILVPSLKGTAESMSSLANSMYSMAKNTINQVKSSGKVAKNSNDASKQINKLAESQNKNAESADKASKANKEMSDNLQSFDEINKLNVDTASAGSGAGDTIGPTVDLSGINTGAFENIGGSFENLSSKVEEFKRKMQELAPIIGLVGTVLVGLGIGKIVIDVINLAGGFEKLIGVLKNPKFWGIMSILLGIALGIKAIKDMFDQSKEPIQGFMEGLGAVALIALGVGLIFGGIPALITALVGVIVAFVVLLISRWEDIKEAWKIICELVSERWHEIWTTIKDFFKEKWQWICEKAKNIGDTFKNAWTSIKNGFTDTWNGIKNFFKEKYEWVCQKAEDIGKTFSNTWNNIKNGFIKLWNNIKSFASNIGITVANAVGGTIKSVVNSIIGFAEKTINGFIKAINLAIGVINAIPGVNISKLNLLNIPRLANGGVATSSKLVNIGEGRYDEAVIPLGNSPQFATMKRDIADAVVEGIGRTSNNGGTRKLEIDILAGGVRVGKKIIDLMKDTAEFYDMELDF